MLSAGFLAVAYLPAIISPKGWRRLINFSWINNTGRVFSVLITIIYFVLLAIPVISEIEQSSLLIIMGIVLVVPGIIGLIASYTNYFTAPGGQLITKGVYKSIRNPIYLFTLFVFSGMAFLCGSIVMGVLIVIYFFLQLPIVKEEERFCLETYGNEYIEYKNSTRRFI